MNSRTLFRCLILTLVFSVMGCATQQTPQFNARYYPECYDPIDKLCKDQSHKSEITGAVTGGLIGALGGALVGGLSTGKIQGVLIGAAAGATAGALTGFFAARLNKIQDQDQRLAEYQNVLGEQAKGWDLERASVERAYKCYGEQINLLKAAVKTRKINREEFLARMNEIKEGINNINTYWASAQTRMDEALADGDKWLAQEDAAAAKAQRQKQVAAKINRQKQNTTQARKNNSVANKRVDKAKENVQVALNELQKYMDVDESFAMTDHFLAMQY